MLKPCVCKRCTRLDKSIAIQDPRDYIEMLEKVELEKTFACTRFHKNTQILEILDVDRAKQENERGDTGRLG